jgi:DNA-binding XRE family transcriptional regulator
VWKVGRLMDLDQYIAEREARDPEFKAAREEMRPQYEFQTALIGARIEAGITQREMAKRLEVKQSAIARWEAGETMPTLDTLFRVAKVLRLDFTITPEAPLVVTPHRPAEAACGRG